jgi:two-component system, OmpR family, phosphate regulon sensor histidine kinase PhoR
MSVDLASILAQSRRVLRPRRRFLLNALAMMMIVASFGADSARILAIFGVLLLIVVFIAFRPLRKAMIAANVEPASERNALSAAFPVLDSLAIPVILLDRQESVRHANAPARALFPGLRDGVPISFALRFPELLAAIDRVREGETHTEVGLVERVPVERSFDAHIRAIGGGISGAPNRPVLAITLLDTTKSRQVEAMRVDFVANASHELRTPLASIIGFVETLQGSARKDDAMREKFLGIMAQQGRRMARLIDDLLSLSRIELNAHLLPKGIVDLDLEIGHISETLAGLAREQKVTLTVTSLPPGEAMVVGDRDEILRVFENLIENAIKYGASGGKVEITTSLVAQTDQIHVTVRDYGPGIAPLHVPRLTERFYRADVEASRTLGGTGLGLAIVKHILNRHRGKLLIQSRLGEGATFTTTWSKIKNI